MISMRTLLAADPSLSRDTRASIANHQADSRERLVRLGLTECEAAELLDERTPCDGTSK